jgi:hypothetical protein
MGLLSKLLHGADPGDERERLRVHEAIARILALSPQLQMVRRPEARLAPPVTAAIRYLDGLIAGAPAAREASAAAWASDPYIHAFFAAAADVAPALSASADLRAFFEQHPELQEAYGVLGMAMAEKHILGVALEGETMRRDVVQQTVSFSDHQVRVCGRSEAELREELVRRLVDQLGLEGLARFAADQSRRGVLEQERALLRARLQLLERQGVGVRGVLGDEPPAGLEELARLHGQIDDNERSLEHLGIRSESLERELGHLCEVLSNPGAHIYVEGRRFRLNRMNVVLSDTSSEAGAEITFEVGRLPTDPPRMRAFTLVRFRRDQLLPASSLSERAARLLG